jgi:hypothetical protein
MSTLRQRSAKSGIAILCSVLLAGCGNNVAVDSSENGREPARPFDLVTPDPNAGAGVPIAVTTARVLADGSTQVLVNGARCTVLTRLEVDETHDSVTASAFAQIVEGTCTAMLVPWFVAVPLAEPLGKRSVRDGQSNSEVPVTDCRRTPDETLCNPEA